MVTSARGIEDPSRLVENHGTAASCQSGRVPGPTTRVIHPLSVSHSASSSGSLIPPWRSEVGTINWRLIDMSLSAEREHALAADEVFGHLLEAVDHPPQAGDLLARQNLVEALPCRSPMM